MMMTLQDGFTPVYWSQNAVYLSRTYTHFFPLHIWWNETCFSWTHFHMQQWEQLIRRIQLTLYQRHTLLYLVIRPGLLWWTTEDKERGGKKYRGLFQSCIMTLTDRRLRAEASCAVDNIEKIYRLETADNIHAENILVLFSLCNIRWLSPPWRFRLSSRPTCHLVLLGRTKEWLLPDCTQHTVLSNHKHPLMSHSQSTPF